MKKRVKGKLVKKIFIVFIVLVAMFFLIGVMYLVSNNKSNVEEVDINEVYEEELVVPDKVSIVDVDSNKRPYAVMINNHEASRPQAGLDQAYLIYEMMVEGGLTRFMALYESDVDVDKIGSIRSSRHNYLDYVMENDAIYVHWGYSTYAREDIDKLGIDNINGLIYGNKYFITDNSLNRALEHTRFTSMDLINKATSELKYRTNRNNDYLLNYVARDVDLSELDASLVANEVKVRFSSYVTSFYKYNSSDKYYYRGINGVNHTDLLTLEQYKFKNIIVYAVEYRTISNVGHQDIKNIGSGDGYYITNGYAIPIKWEKNDRASQTIYRYLDGREIEVSDGNTFIEIYPTSGNLEIN